MILTITSPAWPIDSRYMRRYLPDCPYYQFSILVAYTRFVSFTQHSYPQGYTYVINSFIHSLCTALSTGHVYIIMNHVYRIPHTVHIIMYTVYTVRYDPTLLAYILELSTRENTYMILHFMTDNLVIPNQLTP